MNAGIVAAAVDDAVANATEIEPAIVVLRVAAAALLGGVIGFEREVDGHEAGTRTHALLALGAALLGAVSVGAFHEFVTDRAGSNVQVDVTRIASYVAAGIGFLGAGAIIKRSERIEGLTTAASLWVAAAIGLAAGLGFWTGAIAVTVIAVLALVSDRPVMRLVNRLQRRTSRRITLVVAAGTERADAIRDVVAAAGPDLWRLSWTQVGAEDADATPQSGAPQALVVDLHKRTGTKEMQRAVAAMADHGWVVDVTTG